MYAYTAALYDTPSGHLDPGYYLDAVPTSATTTITGTVAHEIGTQSWVVCDDKQGNTHEFTMTADDYAKLALPDASMPQETVMEPASQAAIDSF